MGASAYSSGQTERILKTRCSSRPGISAQASVKVPPLSMAMRMPWDDIVNMGI